MSLWQMSFSGAVMILAIAAIRAVTLHRIPKRAFLILWGIALVRLAVPYSLPADFSVYTLLKRAFPAAEAIWNRGMYTAEEYSPAAQGVEIMFSEDFAMEPGKAVPSARETEANEVVVAARGSSWIVGTDRGGIAVSLWTVLWMAGALFCAAYYGIVYLKCRREFGESLPATDAAAGEWLREHPLRRKVSIRSSDCIASPLTYGIRHPVILMPKRTDWKDGGVKYVLAHEYIHIRRFDAAAKLLLTAVLCVHWFNPAVWLMCALANRDMELSCDEAVIRMFGEGAKVSYAAALIRMEERKSGFVPLFNHFNKNVMEERIDAIMKWKKKSVAALLAAVVLTAGVTAFFSTSGKAEGAPTVELVDIDIAQEDTVQIWRPVSESIGEDGKSSVIEWWTEEKYIKWLEEEKKNLQSCIGEWAWTSGDGWFVWDQKRVDQTIAAYEQTLEDIRNGMKVSIPDADGDAMIQFSYDPENLESAAEIIVCADTLAEADAEQIQPGLKISPEIMAKYEDFALVYDRDKKMFFIEGRPVR